MPGGVEGLSEGEEGIVSGEWVEHDGKLYNLNTGTCVSRGSSEGKPCVRIRRADCVPDVEMVCGTVDEARLLYQTSRDAVLA